MSAAPLAMVLGDVDLVHALALDGIRSAVFDAEDSGARFSRHVDANVPWVDHWRRPSEAADQLCAFAATQAEPPVLMPQTDGDLFVASRFREQLGNVFRLVLADAGLVEALADKAAFARLGEQLDLPVPPSRVLDPRTTGWHDVDLPAPLIVKPLLRDSGRWSPLGGGAKATQVADEAALRELWPTLEELELPVLVQRSIPGPESRIESYHAYVDPAGRVAGAFTGRKIRTWPNAYGMSSAVEITDVADVARLGQEVLERLGLRGQAKADFKRDEDGRLWLLEVNARFTLWHYPGALAGVNLAALSYADATGRPRPAVQPVRPGVRWVAPLLDVRAARAEGVPLRRWLRFLARTDAVHGRLGRDVLPLSAAALAPVRRRLTGGR